MHTDTWIIRIVTSAMKERYTVRWQNIIGKPNVVWWKDQYGCLKKWYLSWELKEEQDNKLKMEFSSEETLTQAKALKAAESMTLLKNGKKAKNVKGQNHVDNTIGHLSGIYSTSSSSFLKESHFGSSSYHPPHSHVL